ncbi:ABC transporter ATP-binding protein [Ottowia sp.]|uniref:ABC transporter ATP-binding protein n=1 Tax=Ottowia sp. TaxID=1898956 RepID=UPI002B749555|nr:ABC transporter ATP-binding protein [Ottowia sp.]HPR43223.1 ABC transporter ATP-binding protein [Ottowia sp.]HRW72598.1 ABC transporter ATP-binding protein [Ottowia sp.]
MSATGSTTEADNAPLRLEGVGKAYRLYDSPRARLKSLLTGRDLHHSHWALRDVSLELRRGQCLGVVGHNGAGKSTLLKLITGTLQPSTGKVLRRGRVTAILELGAGFHPDFTGRENLYFGGNLIGISREEMARLEPQVLAFAEIGEAIDRPVKTYSSGMVVRLAFALVTAVEPDLLIIDEALAVGDQRFQKKCIERIEAFRRNGCTILFCSHSPYHVRHLCDVALWLDGGQVQRIGPTEAVLLAYETHTRLSAASGHQAAEASAQASEALIVPTEDVAATLDSVPRDVSHPPVLADAGSAAIVSVQLESLQDPEPGSHEPALLAAPDLVAQIVVRGVGDECPNIGFMIEQSKGVGITSIASHEEGAAPQRQPDGTWKSVLTFPDLPLHSGEYVVSVYLFDASGLVVYDQWYQFLHFRFVAPTRMPGLVRLPHQWS